MSKSNAEELVGVLWLILSVLLYQNNAPKILYIPPLAAGLLCLIAAIFCSKAEKLKKSLKDGE